MPHSRHSGIDEEATRSNKNLKILLEGVGVSSENSGITALKDSKDFFILGHPEYAKNTLDLEYKRDLDKGLEIAKPINYYNESGIPVLSWRSSASVLFSNWLNFSVYQDTPFIL